MRTLVVLAIALLVGGGWLAYEFDFDRAPPHRFVVTLDAAASSAKLTLGNSDGDATTIMDGGPREFTASRFLGDASGAIQIEWIDGTTTECTVGYVTNGETEPHIVGIEDRKCPEIGAHVQL